MERGQAQIPGVPRDWSGRHRRRLSPRISFPCLRSRNPLIITHRKGPFSQMSETSLTYEFQYSSAQHQAETAVSGMWLFLATEVLFFGALFLAWIYARHWNQAGFDMGAQQTSFVIGTANTVILITSSFVYSAGIAFITAGNSRRLSNSASSPGCSEQPSSSSNS